MVKLFSSLRPIPKAERPLSETCVEPFKKIFLILFKKTSLSKINFALAIKGGRLKFLNLDFKRKGSLKRAGMKKSAPQPLTKTA